MWSYSDIPLLNKRQKIFALDGSNLSSRFFLTARPTFFFRNPMIKIISISIVTVSVLFSSLVFAGGHSKGMYIHIINFNITGIDRSQYEAAAMKLTSVFAAVPGLKRKHWLANEENNTYGGVYIFDSKESHDAFVESKLYAGVKGNPSFINFSGKSFENIGSLAKHTRGAE